MDKALKGLPTKALKRVEQMMAGYEKRIKNQRDSISRLVDENARLLEENRQMADLGDDFPLLPTADEERSSAVYSEDAMRAYGERCYAAGRKRSEPEPPAYGTPPPSPGYGSPLPGTQSSLYGGAGAMGGPHYGGR